MPEGIDSSLHYGLPSEQRCRRHMGHSKALRAIRGGLAPLIAGSLFSGLVLAQESKPAEGVFSALPGRIDQRTLDSDHELLCCGNSGSQEIPGQSGKPSKVASGKDFVPPRLIKTVAPIYPKLALRMGIEGVVVVEATTDLSGRVTNTKVLKSVPALDKAACAAIKKWVYEPFIFEGRPRPVIFTVILKFSVSGNSDLSDMEPPKLTLRVEPVYPEEAKREKIEGTVVLGITIGETGLVSEVKVLESVPGLDQAAIDAVRKWQYTGAWVGGRPVIYSTTVSIKFSLNRAP